MNEKIGNMINDIHYKTITKLMDNKIIFIPRMNTKQMMEGSDLCANVKRLMQVQKHGLFIRRLQEKCEIKKIKCEIVTERSTTKTCGICFNKNEPKKSKIYKCSSCGIEIDRDINGARNIYIQQLINKKNII